MEHHTAASTYIPSSKVLARLQRHTTKVNRSPLISSSNSFPGRADSVTGSGTSTSVSSRLDTAAATAAAATTVRSVSTSSAVQAQPYYPTRSPPLPRLKVTDGSESAVVQSTALPPAELSAQSTTAASVSFVDTNRGERPGDRGNGLNSNYIITTKHDDVAAASSSLSTQQQDNEHQQTRKAISVTHSTSAAAPSSTTATWLLPQDDLAYVFSSLTWNIDLLRVLLPHAPCPLRLPAPAEATHPPSASLPAAPEFEHEKATMAATSVQPRNFFLHPDSAVDDNSTNLAAADGDGEGENEEATVLRAWETYPARMDEAQEEEEGRPRTACTSKHTTTSVLPTLPPLRVVKRNDAFEDEEDESTVTTPRHDKKNYGGRRNSSTYRECMQESESGEVEGQPTALKEEHRKECCPTGVSTTPTAVTSTLTWSQYLFRGHSTSCTPAPSGWKAQGENTNAAPVSGNNNNPSSHVPPNISPFTAVTATVSSSSYPNKSSHNTRTSVVTGARSIFHSHYLPSVEEFQRDLEAQRQQQQQQQGRRTAPNKTFFYPPTPSVVSLAKTSVTVNALLDEETEKASNSNEPNKNYASGNTMGNSSSSSTLASARHRSYAAAVAAVSSRSSPVPSCAATPSFSRSVKCSPASPHGALGLTELRLGRRMSSTSSLDNLCAFEDGSSDVCGTGLKSGTPHHLHSTSGNHHNSRSVASLSASMCSRLTFSQQQQQLQQQQPSAMMMRAADRLRASIVASVHEPSSPAGNAPRHALHISNVHHNSDNNANNTSVRNGGSPVASKKHKKQRLKSVESAKENNSSESEDNDDDGSNDSSSDSSEDGVLWLRSHVSHGGSSVVFPSSPLSPVASISSTTFNKVWSSVASGRATPHSNAGAGSSSGNYCGSRRKKRNLRRRKAASTRRQRTIRVYVPSITEGPKAASLYTAPTAEAQELLLQLQHRASVLARSTAAPPSASTTCVTPLARTSHLLSVPLLSPALMTTTHTPATAAAAASNPQVQTPVVPSLFTESTNRHNGAGAVLAGDSLGSRHGNEQHAIHSSLLHTSTAVAATTTINSTMSETSAAASAVAAHTDTLQKPSAHGRLMHGHLSTTTTHRSSYLAAARASLSSSSFSASVRQSPALSSLSAKSVDDVAEGGVSAKTSPDLCSQLPSSSSPLLHGGVCFASVVSGAEKHNTDFFCPLAPAGGGGGVVGEEESGGECCDRASLSEVTTEYSEGTGAAAGAATTLSQAPEAPPTPVELPNWVRERSLAALYYQPWGLELLARYEQQQQLRQQQQKQQTHSRSVTQHTTRQRVASTPENGTTATTTTTPLSTFQRVHEGGFPQSHAGSASLNSSLSSKVSFALAPKLHSTGNDQSNNNNNGGCGGGDGGSTTAPAISGNSTPRRPPVLTRASLGTARTVTANADVDVSVTSALPRSSLTATTTTATPHLLSVSSVSRVSWAAALRQSHTSHPAAASSSEAARSGSRGAAAPATRTSTTSVPGNRTHFYPVPDWPPELSVAEEQDAREEAFYFFCANTATAADRYRSLLYRSESSNVALVEHAAGGEVEQQAQGNNNHYNNTVAATALQTASSCNRSYEWWAEDMAHLPTLYLSRQKRSRRRLRAIQDYATARSSTARKGSATSAAAELQSKRANARTSAVVNNDDDVIHTDASVTSTTFVPTAAAARVTSKEDLILFGDTYRRKKAAQLYYPPPSSSSASASSAWMKTAVAVAAPRTVSTQPKTIRSMAFLCHPSSSVSAAALERTQASPHVQPLLSTTQGIAEEPEEEAATTTSTPGLEAEANTPGSAEVAAKVQHGGTAVSSQPQQHQRREQQEESHLAKATVGERDASSREDPAAAGAAASTKTTADDGATAAAAIVHSVVSLSSPLSAQQQQPAPEIDINFFLQKFLRAVLIVVITQVRLQQAQRRAHVLEQQRRHDLSCPVSGYLFDRSPAFLPLSCFPSCASLSQGHCEMDNGAHGLSEVERHALAFVRRHISDYKAIMTTYVMRSDKEVARRSAQSILTDDLIESTTAVSGHPFVVNGPAKKEESVNPVNSSTTGSESPHFSDPLFQRRVFESCLNASRVNGAYEAVVHAPTGYTDTLAPTSTALDDVEPLRIAQLYIGGKDAAWQPLLMELLQVSRVVQCYSEDTPQSNPNTVTSSEASITAATPSTPQQHLLFSLEKFLAQSTVPLLRTDSTSFSASLTVDALPQLQAAAASQMIEESEAFRQYLLASYLNDTTAPSTVSSLGRASCPTPSLQQQQPPTRCVTPLLQPLTWYPYAYMPGTASPYAESADPHSTRITPAQAASASAMTLYVATLPLSGRLLWKWVIPAEDTDTFNLSVFFQSTLFSFMQGGPLPMPTNVFVLRNNINNISSNENGGGGGGATLGTTPASISSLRSHPPQQLTLVPSCSTWPPILAASIDARLRQDAACSAWGLGLPPCTCGASSRSAVYHHHSSRSLAPCEKILEETEATLVHCSAGMHRSCGILVAFLLWLLYQCRQVLTEEQRLRLNNQLEYCCDFEALESVVKDALIGCDAVGCTCTQKIEDEEQQQLKSSSVASPSRKEVVADGNGKDSATLSTEDEAVVTSRLLQRCIQHVQERRNIAVPIRTVRCLLQSFATELQLS